jgi:DNA-binding protein
MLNAMQEDLKKHIIVVGKGVNVNKAVTVVELVKRRMQGTLHQYTQIGSVSVVEQWDATEDKALDR